jgi:hypothetical protein
MTQQLNAANRLVATEVKAAPKMFLWMHNTQTGVWDQQRDVTPETKDQWMQIFQKDKPHARFVVSERRPKAVPNQPGERS